MAPTDMYQSIRQVLKEFASGHCGAAEEIVGNESHRLFFGLLGKKEAPVIAHRWELEEGHETKLVKNDTGQMSISERHTIVLDFCHVDPPQAIAV